MSAVRVILPASPPTLVGRPRAARALLEVLLAAHHARTANDAASDDGAVPETNRSTPDDLAEIRS